MNFIKRSDRPHPKVSLVLLDWSVRESFHLLYYLRKQTVDRDDFEVIVIEYYSRVSDVIRKFEDQVDTWVALEMPENCYYHKHLMYNAGIVLSRGEVVMIGDSDAMVKETFIKSIINNFERDPEIVYHIDQFRNMRRKFYPFNYPSFEEVLGDDCINNAGGKTTGVLDKEDPLHSRNYGACMCARRKDLIAIGGADQHIDYLGHICGPYDMTFRLINYGRREIWDMQEFMYHTWHPGQAGADNYLGPHDGRHMSSTALDALGSGRVYPLLENEAIHRLRTGEAKAVNEVLHHLIDPKFHSEWDAKFIEQSGAARHPSDYSVPLGVYKGYRLMSEPGGHVMAYRITAREVGSLPGQEIEPAFGEANLEEMQKRINKGTPRGLSIASTLARYYLLMFRIGRAVRRRALPHGAKPLPSQLPQSIQTVVAAVAMVRTVLVILVASPRRALNRLRQVSQEIGYQSSALANLPITLHNLEKWGSLGRDLGAPVVIIDNRQTVRYLRTLQIVGLLRRFEVRHVADATAMENCLEELQQRGWRGRLIVPGNLYSRFHTVIASFRIAKQALIV